MYYYNEPVRDTKRSLGSQDRQYLYDNAGGRCQNPKCQEKITFNAMVPGHKTAWAKGGKTNLKNSVCLCYACNKKQGTDSWITFLKKQNVQVKNPKAEMKVLLNGLKVQQLKELAKNHKLVVKGASVDTFSGSYTKAPTKSQYVNKLALLVTEDELRNLPKPLAPNPKKRKLKKSNDSWW